jgi:hypothetical protein
MEKYIMSQYKLGKSVFRYSDNEYLYIIDGSILKKRVKSWKYNRPPDNAKITEIVKTVERDGKDNIEGMIYVALIDGNFVCYDGNHRLEALKLMKGKKYAIVNLLIVNNDDEIKKRFVEINKANPVPEIYTLDSDDNLEKMKESLEKVVTNLSMSYSKFMSPSKNPQRPNTNKNILMDKLYNRYKSCDASKISSDKIYNDIIKLNACYAKNKHINHKKFSKKMLDKCKKHGCYLFLKDFTEDLSF